MEEDRGKEMLRFELIWMSLKEERGNGIHGHQLVGVNLM